MAISVQDIDISNYIDHSLLNPMATSKDLEICCNQAIEYNFPVICVYPNGVRQAREILANQKIKVTTVIGFPTGATTSAVKLYEAQEAIENGAVELDVVINLGWLKAGETDLVYQEIASICEQTQSTVKAILETTCLTPAEKRLAAEICSDAGVSFLKTSTGWFGGATVEDVQLLQQITKGRVGIKASGGIGTLEQAIALINAGANRLGTSQGVSLVEQQKNFVKG